ncbi:hypothetical protein [Nocardiopsis sp. NPDC006938]|uniref:hypothetical protein n=1 Tax=Nocardiopsis sp. NPDC006938 TaxID=3364337 RepID=UPI003699C2FD
MEKHSGRHRKRRQGWGEHLRWVLGAVLAAVFCSPTGQSTRPVTEARQPLPAWRPAQGRGPGLGGTASSRTEIIGSDLSNLSGLASQHGAKVTEIQLRQLSVVMIRDLDLTIAEIPL